MSDTAIAATFRRTAGLAMLANARAAYLHGLIDVGEFEDRVGCAVELEARPLRPHDCARDGHVIEPRVEITAFGDSTPRFLGDPACHVCGQEP